MNLEAKKTVLRMIPYGLYVLTAEDTEGRISGATVNWVTQASFQPPLVAVGVKQDSLIHDIIGKSSKFALNVLGKNQEGMAFAFFKPVEKEGDKLGGHAFHLGEGGCPLLDEAPAFMECTLVSSVEKGDHSLFVGEVIQAGVNREPEGRADEATLWMLDLGEKTFYGG